MILMEFTLSILAYIKIIYIYIYMRPTLQLLEGQTDRSHKAYTGNFGIWHVSVELQDFQHCTASRVASTQ